MSGQSVAIVGTGPAGLNAARAYRRCGGSGRVLLLGEEAHPPYRRPPLSKEFLRGETDTSALWLESENWYEANGIELRLDAPVAGIDPARRELSLAGDERIAVQACLLATGSRPVRPPVPGAEDPAVLVLRRLSDSLAIRDRVSPGARVVVIGSGFIGCEVAASLAARGARVTMLSQEGSPLLERLGEAAAERIRSWLEGEGIDVRGATEVTALDGGHVLAEGQHGLVADLVILGAGVQPRSELAAASGIRLRDAAVETDSRLRTSDPFLLAAGDVAFAHNRAAGRPIRIEHWGDALAQGEVAGRILAGVDAEWDTVPGSGRRSGRTRSSTRPGATALTGRAWTHTARRHSRSGTARAAC